ncbi:HDOD domain-containing protein [candidate division KSB1 bacterium]
MKNTLNEQYHLCIENIEALAPAPVIFTQILDCVEDPDSTSDELRDLILQDQALTAKILSIANSAYFGTSKTITDVKGAIIRIGYQNVMEIAIGVIILGAMQGAKKSDVLDNVYFWQYSLACAEASKFVAKAIHYKQLEQAYIIGLMHDIGRQILIHCFGTAYDEVILSSYAEKLSLVSKEKEILNIDHTEAGEVLASNWRLPDQVIAAIKFHHSVEDIPENYKAEIYITQIAEYITRKIGLGNNGDYSPPELDKRVLDGLRLNEEDIDSFIHDFMKELPRIQAIFSNVL